MKKVTIQDIADTLGISRNTVSKAINNSDGLADDTRERILQKAVEMGYKHFAYAADLVKNSPVPSTIAEPLKGPREIALFSVSISNGHFAALMLDRFRDELAQLGYTLNVHIVERENMAEKTPPRTFHKEQCSAIICIELFDWDYGEMVCRLGLPVLFIDGPHKREGRSLPADQLYMENTMGITKLVNDMLQRGKRRIGFIGDYEHCQSFYERYTAFRCAMLMAGADVDETLCIKDSRHPALDESLSRMRELPDLFLCANDFVAVEAIQVLRKLGKSIPQDVMFAGFDDAPESRIITPALTTVHIHTQIMAFTATHLLMTRIKEPELDYRIVHTETELIYRESTNC